MFDLSELTQDVTIEKVIPVDCLLVEDGESVPEIVVSINDKIRKKERDLSRKYNRLVVVDSGSGTRSQKEGEVRSDRLKYCSELSDLCVTGSSGLFSIDGKPVLHSKDGFRALLLRYPQFLEWFADAVTVAFTSAAAFKQDKDDTTDRD